MDKVSEKDELPKRRSSSLKCSVSVYGWPECGVGFMSPMKRRHGTATVLPTFHQKVVSTETGAALPFDVEGELCLRSPTMMLGYMNNPESTSKVLDSEGWFHTGDIGVLDPAGQTTIVDRQRVAKEVGSSQMEQKAREQSLRL
ncbi:hypothetical protein OESDEN_11995 [Oesophagostomum dentatum]|uniref:AMP-dependent synthetase/ligase domain-containing protein n=1 Tax=Oesophagostomum dentatum TaxID=61180 RepID=A0A0B1SSE9_OESDE|nr:hypothetical protein OESDEN_11995 [Oesophagostomum dentatum]